MRQFYQFSLAGLLLASASAFSAIPAEGWYGGVMGGISYLPQIDATLNNPVTGLQVTTGEVIHSLGGGGGGQIGYRWCYFRFEGQLYIDTNPFDKLTVDNLILKTHYNVNKLYHNPGFPGSSVYLRMKGDTDLAAAFINAYYEYYDEDNDPSIVPYVGLGIGYAYVENKLTVDSITPITYVSSSTTVSDDVKTPIAQIIVGASYFFNDTLSLGADYRFLTTKSIKVSPYDARLQIHTVNFSVNYSFDL